MNDQDIEKIQECAAILKDIYERNGRLRINPSHRDLWIDDIHRAIFLCYQAAYRAKTYDRHDPLQIAKQYNDNIRALEAVKAEKFTQLTEEKRINDQAEYELSGAMKAYV